MMVFSSVRPLPFALRPHNSTPNSFQCRRTTNLSILGEQNEFSSFIALITHTPESTMVPSGIIRYRHDGTPVIILEKANACLAEGVKLMESIKEKLRIKMGGMVEGGPTRSFRGASTVMPGGVAITIDRESIKSTSLDSAYLLICTSLIMPRPQPLRIGATYYLPTRNQRPPVSRQRYCSADFLPPSAPCS